MGILKGIISRLTEISYVNEIKEKIRKKETRLLNLNRAKRAIEAYNSEDELFIAYQKPGQEVNIVPIDFRTLLNIKYYLIDQIDRDIEKTSATINDLEMEVEIKDYRHD